MADDRRAEPAPDGYRYSSARLSCAHECVLPEVERILDSLHDSGTVKRIFDLGCGNGSVADRLTRRGFEVVGVDPSREGIEISRRAFPYLELHEGSCYEDLATRFGHFPVVLSLEVVEHVYDPRAFAGTVYRLLEPGGTAILSTPYHGYWKNLALAVTGRMDAHFTALWDHGHIKFWSIKTLGELLRETGFTEIRFRRVGRVPPLARAMIATCKKPGA